MVHWKQIFEGYVVNVSAYVFAGKKGDKAEESAEAEPMDEATNGATS